jgi:hypothetical protein
MRGVSTSEEGPLPRWKRRGDCMICRTRRLCWGTSQPPCAVTVQAGVRLAEAGRYCEAQRHKSRTRPRGQNGQSVRSGGAGALAVERPSYSSSDGLRVELATPPGGTPPPARIANARWQRHRETQRTPRTVSRLRPALPLPLRSQHPSPS